MNSGLSSRPIIGLCTALERARWSVWDQEAVLLPRNYVTAVQSAGGIALLLPPDLLAQTEPDLTLDLLDGLLLAGGADIDPTSYGEQRHEQTTFTTPDRDRYEIALARRAIERDMPLLGICRGMQLINIALGGNLLQHLPECFGHHEHLRDPGSFDDADHDVRIVEGSLAARVIGSEKHGTKSHHHQGVDRLGEGLDISAWSTIDDLPEALELPNKRFVLGVQWHPEADSASPVIAAFVNAAGDNPS